MSAPGAWGWPGQHRRAGRAELLEGVLRDGGQPAFFPNPLQQVSPHPRFLPRHVPLRIKAEFHFGSYLINVCLLHSTASLPHFALGRFWVEACEDRVRARLLGGRG